MEKSIQNTDCCIICPLFGRDFQYLHPAPAGFDSYIFSNNPDMKVVAENAGWKFIFVDFPLSNDIVESTLQSKYIKFLAFLRDDKFSDFKKYSRIIHTDHKLALTSEHVHKIFAVQNRPLLQLSHPDVRNNIWEEFGASMFQERYLRHVWQIIDYIRDKVRQGYREDCGQHMLCANGLLSYILGDSQMDGLLNTVYNDSIQTRISQDQIIWFLVAQKYSHVIQIMNWYELNVPWIYPSPAQ